MRARIYMQDKKDAEAINELKKSLQRKPNFEPALYQYGVYMLMVGQTKQAISILRTLVQYNPNHANGMYYLAQSFIKEGRLQEALMLLQKLVIRNPDNKELIAQMTAVQTRLHGGESIPPKTIEETDIPKDNEEHASTTQITQE